MVRRRILGFAIGKMLRQDGWAEKYNPKNQFHVNQGLTSNLVTLL